MYDNLKIHLNLLNIFNEIKEKMILAKAILYAKLTQKFDWNV